MDDAEPDAPDVRRSQPSRTANGADAGADAGARAELTAWLRLLETPGVGRDTARRLLAAFGSPQAVFAAPAVALRNVVNAGVASALAAPPPGFEALLAATHAWLDAAPGEAPRGTVTLGDARYPAALLHAADPPLLLYFQGDVGLLAAESIAVVGSRGPTPQGADNARHFARELSRAGFVVVSGLALGVDGAAHQGALEGLAAGGASSVAVVGTGLDQVYPRRHAGLAQQLARRGLLVSEYAIGTPPIAAHFPQRNRIIAGLARGTLVVEAALRSGSLITARLASEAGREVFAIPGSIHSPQARGCHALIRQGAQLVDEVQLVIDELRIGHAAPRASGHAAGAKATAEADADADAGNTDDTGTDMHEDTDTDDGPAAARPDPLLEALGHDPVTLDALVARTGWSAAALSAKLLDLELDGRVARLPGQLFQRLVRA